MLSHLADNSYIDVEAAAALPRDMQRAFESTSDFICVTRLTE